MSYEEPGQPGFNNTCPRCGIALHACANCLHFVPRGSLRCMVPGAEIVLDPTAGNRCKHFEFANVSQAEPARQAAAMLEAPADAATARKRWEQLFKSG